MLYLSRTYEDYSRKTTLDIRKVHRNRDPKLHPFAKEREYTRALVATKLNKMFAKPFIGALEGHADGIMCLCTMRTTSNLPMISGSADGEVRVWDLQSRDTVWRSQSAHSGFVRGIAPDVDGRSFFSCGDDKTVKQWALMAPSRGKKIEPVRTILAPSALYDIDHHWKDAQFATSGNTLCLWDSERNDPLLNYKWGADTITSVRFNPAEACLLASTGSDRSVCLYDMRASVPMRKFVMSMKSNCLAWNPQEPFNFTLANEDHNLYTFDMRNLSKALMIHKDHVSAVMSVAYSPTGKEFVSGSYDRTVRIFKTSSGRSREIYHSKRMQRVSTVRFTSDANFVLSGSDDTNVRIWKAQSSKALGVQKGRKQRSERINDAVMKRYAHMPEIRRITNDKPVPKSIKKASKLKHIQMDAERRKHENRKRHAREGQEDITIMPERKRAAGREFK